MKQDLVKLRHDRSHRDYPELSLEDDEYVELHVLRTKVGLWFILLGAILSLIIFTIFMFILLSLTANLTGRAGWPFLIVMVCILYLCAIVIAFAAAYVYKNNILFVTNHRVIQLTQTSLFSRSTNIIELSRIEDVSFKQTNPIQHIFKYGTIRLSTVGDETTYTFKFIDTPQDEMDTITRLVHEAKDISHSSAGSN